MRAKVAQAKAIQADVNEILDGAPKLPPEALRAYEAMVERNPDCKVTFERRIFMRATNEADLCVDVRNLPDQ